MKSIVLASVVLTSSFAAFADGGVYEPPKPATSELTRTQVVADLDAARAHGPIASGENYLFVAAEPSARLTRAEVRAELRSALENGLPENGEGAFLDGGDA